MRTRTCTHARSHTLAHTRPHFNTQPPPPTAVWLLQRDRTESLNSSRVSFLNASQSSVLNASGISLAEKAAPFGGVSLAQNAVSPVAGGKMAAMLDPLFYCDAVCGRPAVCGCDGGGKREKKKKRKGLKEEHVEGKKEGSDDLSTAGANAFVFVCFVFHVARANHFD